MDRGAGPGSHTLHACSAVEAARSVTQWRARVYRLLAAKDTLGYMTFLLAGSNTDYLLNFLNTGSIKLNASNSYSRVFAPVKTIFPLTKINITSLGFVNR